MPNDNTNNSSFLEATAELGGFFGVKNENLQAVFGDSGPNPSDLSELEQILVNQVFAYFDGSVTGGKFVSEIQRDLKDLVADSDPELFKQIMGFFNDETGDYSCPVKPVDSLFVGGPGDEDKVSNIPGSTPTKFTPALSAIQVFPANLQFAGTNASRLQVFFNFIPTLEMSRCVPYFDLRVISSEPAVRSGQASGLSQIKFLFGNEEIGEGSINEKLAGGFVDTVTKVDPKTLAEETFEVSKTLAGMELFTSPQTLVNAEDSYFEPILGETPDGVESWSTPVLDKFRPLMTIKKFDVSVTPAFGAAGYKTAKLSLALHDRSRLAQVAPLVQPDLYGNTELLIEWGWSHPETDSTQNPVGAFINGLRRSEKFAIVNSSYTFTKDGQVDINLELVTKGGVDNKSAMISEGEGAENILESVGELIKEASKLYQSLTKTKLVKDVLGTTIIRAASSTSSAMNIDEKSRKEIKEFIRKNSNSSNDKLKGLAGQLASLYGVNGKGGQVSEAKKSIKSALETKMKILKNKKDPFASPFPMPGKVFDDTAPPKISVTGPGKYGGNYASLGKVLMVYVGKALASKGKYDEIQFIFYGFNSKASFFRHHNISQFPIELNDLERTFKENSGEDHDMSINQFIDFINDNYIENRLYEPWGLKKVLTQVLEEKEVEEDGVKKKKWVAKENVSDSVKADLEDDVTNAIRPAYPAGADIILKMPQLRVEYDTAPHIDDNGKTILRIYVYDKVASPLEPSEILWSLIGEFPMDGGYEPEPVGPTSDDIDKYGNQAYPTNHDKFLSKAWAEALEAGVIISDKVKYYTVSDDPNVKTNEEEVRIWRPNGSLGRLKEFLRSRSTSAIVGSEYSPVIAANLSSIHDPALSTIKMKQFANDTAGSVIGQVDYGIPAMIQPAELSVEMLGNPLLNFTEKIFFDFNTSTNADAFYYVTGIDHSITNGSFKTTAKWIQDWSFEQFRSPASVVKRALERTLGAISNTSVGGGPIEVKVKNTVESVKAKPVKATVPVQLRYALTFDDALFGVQVDYTETEVLLSNEWRSGGIVRIEQDQVEGLVNETYIPISGEYSWLQDPSLEGSSFDAPLYWRWEPVAAVIIVGTGQGTTGLQFSP
jgi:hypothetical protein